MMPVDAIELHDALLKSTVTDYVTKTIEMVFEIYMNTDDTSRKQVSVVFEGVESISQISNLDNLNKNAFAGNVNYWIPEQHGNTTYIYLCDGCIAIKADKIHVKIN
jgi:hypothetical protein